MSSGLHAVLQLWLFTLSLSEAKDLWPLFSWSPWIIVHSCVYFLKKFLLNMKKWLHLPSYFLPCLLLLLSSSLVWGGGVAWPMYGSQRTILGSYFCSYELKDGRWTQASRLISTYICSLSHFETFFLPYLYFYTRSNQSREHKTEESRLFLYLSLIRAKCCNSDHDIVINHNSYIYFI